MVLVILGVLLLITALVDIVVTTITMQQRRRLMLALVRNDGWSWDEIGGASGGGSA